MAVSSTVIPLTVYEVSYGFGGKPSKKYMDEYVKHLHKKHKTQPFDADTLITCKISYRCNSNSLFKHFFITDKKELNRLKDKESAEVKNL